MNASDARPARMRLAIALSIAAHLCALWLVAALLDDRFIPLSNETDNGATSFITTIEHRIRATAASGRHVRAARLTRKPAALVARPLSALPPTPIPNAAPRLSGPMKLAAPPRTAASSGGIANRTLSSRHRVVPQQPTSLPTAAPTAKPALAAASRTPVAEPTRSPAAVVPASFGGLFSADYPPALAAPSDVTVIHALLNGPARIRIDVDETGQATEVRFLIPVADPQIERAVREKLLALHYVPADCNGLHCEGTLELRF
jgi:hypothetical protein